MYQAYGNTRLARQLAWWALIISGVVLVMASCTLCTHSANLLWLVMLMLTADVGVVWYAVQQGVLFELMLERTWKNVCGGIGFSGQATSYKYGLQGAMRGDKKTIYPKLRSARGDRASWSAIITPFAGQKLDDYNKHVDSFTLAYHVPFVTFELADNGLIRMRCGAMPVPAKYGYSEPQNASAAAVLQTPVAAQSSLADRLREVNIHDVVQTFDERATLQAVPMARDIEGRPFYLPIEGNHLLIVGRTGSGKGSWVYSLVFGLAKARRAGLVRLWGLDPKRVELGYAMEWWDEYADTVEGMIELLEKAVSELLERNAQLQGKARKITPSRETPVNVIIIDELAYLSAMVPDKKLQQRADTAIRTILILGRATGYALCGASQDPRKEILGFRDYFPTRVALGMPAPMVDLVLGEKMHDAGAFCEQIPLRDAGAGCAYVLEEMSAKPKLVRAAWCSDEDIKQRLGVSLSEMYPELQQSGGAPLQPHDEPVSGYEQGYAPQSGFDSQPLQQWQHREE